MVTLFPNRDRIGTSATLRMESDMVQTAVLMHPDYCEGCIYILRQWEFDQPRETFVSVIPRRADSYPT